MPGCEGAGAVFVSPSAVVIRELGLTRFIFGVGGGGREAKAKSDSKTTAIDDDDDDDVRRGGLDSTHALTATQVPATAICGGAHRSWLRHHSIMPQGWHRSARAGFGVRGYQKVTRSQTSRTGVLQRSANSRIRQKPRTKNFGWQPQREPPDRRKRAKRWWCAFRSQPRTRPQQQTSTNQTTNEPTNKPNEPTSQPTKTNERTNQPTNQPTKLLYLRSSGFPYCVL